MKKRFLSLIQYFTQSRIEIAIIALLGLIPLLWFKDGYLISGGDFTIPFHPLDNLINHLFYWNSGIYAGFNDSPALSQLFPYLTFLAFLDWVGLSLAFTERLLFVLLFVLPGFSMYYLMTNLLNNSEKKIAVLVSSIFYMFNPYIFMEWHDGHQLLFLMYAVTPLLLGMCVKGLNTNKNVKYAILIGFASLICAPMGSNPPMLISGVIPIILYFIYFIMTNKKLKKPLFFLLYVTIFFLLFNFWWVLPLGKGVSGILATLYSTVITPGINWPGVANPHASFLELFRLLGFWAWYGGYKGIPYYSFAHYYSSNLILVISGFLLSISAFSVLMVKFKRKIILFFVFLCLFSLFMAKGTHPPFGWVYEWMYLNIPGFWTFRSPWYKFMNITMLSYAILIGMGSACVYIYFKSKKKSSISSFFYKLFSKIFVIVIILLIFVYSWPLFTGDVIEKKAHVKIPQYFDDAGNWINRQSSDFKIFLLPQQIGGATTGYYINYNWGYSGGIIMPHFIYKPLIIPGGIVYTTSLVDQLYKSIESNKSIAEVLRLMNTKYILQRNSVDLESYPGIDSPQRIKSVLSSQKGIHLEKTFGELDFYKISDEYFLPHIYASPDKTGL